MDLVASVRKEGSRGGRSSFTWEDVKQSQHRENYLGHSVMAPVGRWQQGRDLSWYAKGDDDGSAEASRESEMRRVKEAEHEAMARALGLPVSAKSENPNTTQLGGKDVERAVRETAGDDDNAGDDAEGARGIGFGGFGGPAGMAGATDQSDKLEAVGIDKGAERQERKPHRRHRGDGQRSRGRSRDREKERDRKSRKRDYDAGRNERRNRSRSTDRVKDRDYRRRRSLSRSEDRDRRHRRAHRHSRSRSPDPRGETRRENHQQRRHRYEEGR